MRERPKGAKVGVDFRTLGGRGLRTFGQAAATRDIESRTPPLKLEPRIRRAVGWSQLAKEPVMPKGKDPHTADGLGGVHKIAIPRQPVPRAPGQEREPRPQEPRTPPSRQA